VLRVIFITNEQELDLKSGLSAIYFYAAWYPFNKRVINLINSLDTTIRFYAVDIEAFPKLQTKYRLSSLPTIKVFQDEGYQVKTITKDKDFIKLNAILADIEQKYGDKHGIHTRELYGGHISNVIDASTESVR
jgi:Thioredoxin